MLIVVCGCTDPETIAKRSSEETAKVDRATTASREAPGDAADRSPAAERETPASESAEQPESLKPSGRKSPRVGNRDGRARLNSGITGKSAGDRGSAPESEPDSSLDADAASNEMDAESSDTETADAKPPKEEFKFEFVSSTGKEGLEPGDTVPEITGKDLDNIKFNLSDYEGKVIMLDFWGDW